MLVYVRPSKARPHIPILSERAGIVSTARIEGPLRYRGASASIEIVPAFSPTILLRARVPGARTNVGVLPSPLSCAFCEQEGHMAAPLTEVEAKIEAQMRAVRSSFSFNP